MTLLNYRSEEKVEKLLKDLDIVEKNVLDQHELGFQKVFSKRPSSTIFPWMRESLMLTRTSTRANLCPLKKFQGAQKSCWLRQGLPVPR